MAKVKQLVSASNQRRLGNTFFSTTIVLGVLALLGIWLNETRSFRTSDKPRQLTTQAKRPAIKSEALAAQVVLLAKANLGTNHLVEVRSSAVSPAQPVAAVISAVPEPVLPDAGLPATAAFIPRPAQNIFEAQVAMARLGISSGSIDGVIGSQTRAALAAFQLIESLPVTRELDAATKSKLLLHDAPQTAYVVTTNDLMRLQPLGTDWLSKSRQTHLAYETVLELVAEKCWSHPKFISQLNPSVNWTNLTAGTVLRVSAVEKPKMKASAALIRVSLSGKNLKAFDANGNLLAHFPCSIAQKVEKRPIGELHVETIATDPDYTFNPANFPESPEARRLNTKLIISPGPNNPVGTVWIGLDKPGYGIHGTPAPEQVGRTESHGCFRLANWNAEHLVRLVSVGTPVVVEP